MALCCHPAVEMGKVFRLGLHPDEGRLGGVEGLLEGSVGVLGDVRILGFLSRSRAVVPATPGRSYQSCVGKSGTHGNKRSGY